MKLVKWSLVTIAVLGLVAWVAAAALVMLWDPERQVDEPLLERAVGEPAGHLFLFPPGYADRFQTVSWEGDEEDPPEDAHRTSVVLLRGLLDRDAQIFPLSLRYAVNETGALARVELQVTSHGGWSDTWSEDVWQTIGQATLYEAGGWSVALVDGAEAPASSRAYRVSVTRRDGTREGGFSKSMPTAPTLLGRVYDHIAWWPIFRWLPDLR
jgi:hypothetical protein